MAPDHHPLLSAEPLVHEVAHIKMDIAATTTRLYEDDGRLAFRHPWRPDARPLRGVLFGIHAFLAVSELYRRAADVEAQPWMYRAACRAIREVGECLPSLLGEERRFNEEGVILLQQLSDHHEALNRWAGHWNAL